MATIGDLVVNFGANSRQFDRKSRAMKSSLQSLSSFALRVAGPVAAVFGTRESIRAAMVQRTAEKKLESVLRSMGNAAGLTAQEIKDYASELQKVTNFGDEATISAAAMLATFKQIGGETFKEALAIAQDMATILGTSLESNILQVGKALNDPARQMTFLRKSGVSLTEEQQNQIRALQQQGDILGAQRIILDELQKEFGGAAQAAADPFKQMSGVIGDLSEAVGEVIIEFGTALIGSADLKAGVAQVADQIKSLAPAAKQFGTTINNVVRGVVAFVTSIWLNLSDVLRVPFEELPKFAGAAFDWILENIQTMFANIVEVAKNLPKMLDAAGRNIGEEIAFQLGLSDERMQFDPFSDFRPQELTPFEMPELGTNTQQLIKKIGDAIDAAIPPTFDDPAEPFRESEAARQKAAQAQQTEDKEQGNKVAGALMRGSEEAYNAIIQAMQSGTREQAAIRNERNTREAAGRLGAIENGIDQLVNNLSVVESFA